MANVRRIRLIIAAGTLKVLGLAFYIGGAVTAIGIVTNGYRALRHVDSFNELLTAVGGLLLGFVLATALIKGGHWILCFGKKLSATAQAHWLEEKSKLDARPPVLYLRSFNDDELTAATPTAYDIHGVELPRLSTEEEHLARALGDIGPFQAIAKPDAAFPDPGAVRITPGQQSWQKLVIKILERARLVVIRVGEGEWLWWEIEQAIGIVKPQRLLFLIPNDEQLYQSFVQRIEPLISHSIPQYVYKQKMPSTLGAILYFSPDGKPLLSPLKDSQYRSDKAQPLRPMLRIALKPVFEQLGQVWTPPPVPLQVILPVVFFGWFFSLCVYWLTEWTWAGTFSPKIPWFLSLFFLLILFVPFLIAMFGLLGSCLNLYQAVTEFKPSEKN